MPYGILHWYNSAVKIVSTVETAKKDGTFCFVGHTSHYCFSKMSKSNSSSAATWSPSMWSSFPLFNLFDTIVHLYNCNCAMDAGAARVTSWGATGTWWTNLRATRGLQPNCTVPAQQTSNLSDSLLLLFRSWPTHVPPWTKCLDCWDWAKALLRPRLLACCGPPRWTDGTKSFKK